MKKKKPHWDFECAILGGGPGGLACALYLLRFKRKVVLFQSGTPRVRWAPKIHNFLGHPDGVAGLKLLGDFKRQLKPYPEFKCVERTAHLKRLGKGFLITDERGVKYRVKKVVIATGVSDVQPALLNLDPLRRAGYLRYCSVCDGYEMCKQPIAVLAKDDEGIRKALFICTWTNEVKVFVPTHYVPSPRIHAEIIRSELQWIPCDDMQVRQDKKRGGVWIEQGEDRFFATVLYVELGATVNSSAFRGIRGLHKSSEGYILASTEQRTSIRGLYAVGDCVNRLGQVSVALGQAAIAASNIHDELRD